jgi:hypothetical protein
MPETSQPSHDDLVKALIHESEEVQSGVARAQGALYTSSGVILPLLTGVFVIAAKENLQLPALRVLALVFVVTLALAGMWSQYLWMELIRYTTYKHLTILPRLYEATGQANRPNFLDVVGKQSITAQLPILLFNIGCFVVLITVHVALVSQLRWPLQVVSLAFMSAVVLTTLCVFREAQELAARTSKQLSTSA